MRRIQLMIDGMHCDGCAGRIGVLLTREPGVRKAHVSFATGSADVRYNSHAVGEARLREIVETAGFDIVEQGASAASTS